MAVSRALKRLLRIRELEEEQSRIALESVLGELHRVEVALTHSGERERMGREMVRASAQSAEPEARQAGLVEMQAAAQTSTWLTARKAEVEKEVIEQREAFLMRQMQRRQAETLVDEAERRQFAESARKEQHALDDWHRTRQSRQDDRRDP